MKELRIQTLKRSNHRAAEALKLLDSGKISTTLITHSLPLEKTPQAFEMLTHYTHGVGKAVIEI